MTLYPLPTVLLGLRPALLVEEGDLAPVNSKDLSGKVFARFLLGRTDSAVSIASGRDRTCVPDYQILYNCMRG